MSTISTQKSILEAHKKPSKKHTKTIQQHKRKTKYKTHSHSHSLSLSVFLSHEKSLSLSLTLTLSFHLACRSVADSHSIAVVASRSRRRRCLSLPSPPRSVFLPQVTFQSVWESSWLDTSTVLLHFDYLVVILSV